MLRDRDAPEDLFALVPKLQWALDPELAQLDRLLDDDALFARVHTDLARRRPHPGTRGRHATPVEVLLRLLVVKRRYGWSDEETDHFVGDSLILRQCCRVYRAPVPDDTTLIRWANLIGPATVAAFTDRVVAFARSRQVTRGRTLRSDGTVVETHVRYPTASTTRGDGVRLLSRLARRAKRLLGDGATLGQAAFRTRTRSVRRLTQHLHRVARRQGEQAAEARRQADATRIGIARASRRQAARVAAAVQEQATDQGRRLVEHFEHFLPLVDQAIAQATRRVLRGEAVPAGDKLRSLFEPHTQAIRRHKPGKPTACGRTVLLDAVAGGIVSHDAILDDVGLEHPHCSARLDAHQERFGHHPDLGAGDRGLYSPANEERARERGVKRIVLPTTGRVSQERQRQERQRWFRWGCRFRAGAEGRLHVLKRDYGLDRCRDYGEDGFGRWVGWDIGTHNLAQIARTQAARTRQPARQAA